MRRLLLLLSLAGPYEEGRAAEERYAFDEALAFYDQTAEGASRAAWLRARSEGNFAPLNELEHARRTGSPDLQNLVTAANAYPEGLVRVEAWAFAADAYLRRGHPAEAIPLWRKAAHDPKADPILAHAAIRSAVQAHLAEGDLDGAKADLDWLADEGAAKEVDRHMRRRRLHYASIAVIVAVLVVVARARRVAVTRRMVMPLVAFAGFIALGGAVLAWGYEGASAAPFLWFGAALLPLLLLARVWRGAPRLLRVAACSASVVAAAFLVLEQTGHLDGLGL